MKKAALEGYPYVRPVNRGVCMDIDKPGSDQVEEWLERVLYAWGVKQGDEGPRIRITVEVIGPVKEAT
jgi:hypothetical protein